MQKIKVLMIDDNVKLVDAVKEYFKDNDEIDIVLSAYDGLEGFEVITNKINEYDVIVLDLIMPKKDGIYILEKCVKMVSTRKLSLQLVIMLVK